MMETMTSISPRDRTDLDEQDAGHRPATPGSVPSDLREIVMGSQDNLTNVLAVVLGVAIGSGQTATVAVAGLAADGASGPRPNRRPLRAGAVTFAAGIVQPPFWGPC